MKKISVSIRITLLSVLIVGMAAAQITQQTQMYRNEPKGDIHYRKKGLLDGNRVRTVFQNQGEVSDWWQGVVSGPHGEWPKGTGHRSLDGYAVYIASKVKILNSFGTEQYITPLETSYREVMDFDPVTHDLWGCEPVPGYVNEASKSPAINIDTLTFPPQWPRSLFYEKYGTDEESIKKWDGYWYGYFGRGVSNAQLETFFVYDDSKDKEFTKPPYNYFPIQSDLDRGGLGIRVEARGFQWTHVLAEDIIFWHYDVVNLSDRDYDTTAFAVYDDPSVGSAQINDAKFDKVLDLMYTWAPSGVGLPDNYKTGYYAQSFLESPGIGNDHIDNDQDGITDERRDSGPGVEIIGKANILAYMNSHYNMTDFMRFYHYQSTDDIPAVQQGVWWTGDENGNWRTYADANHNGKWDPGEDLYDDVGSDGVGPFDPQYNGPDADGTEGNGRPDDGEPDFDKTDKDESDQIGLQAAYVAVLATDGSGPFPKNDETVWDIMTGGFRDTSVTMSNIACVFSSGVFPLKQNKRERFSVGMIWGNDLNAIIFNKITVQAIYNAYYNFASPPYTPTLSAVPGDKKVYLFWNDVAEKSYDRFLRQFDFEGYLLYRSNEPEFQDIQLVTDSRGEAKYWKPIQQWDLVDSIKGPDPVGINGAHFWRGDDTGLRHSFIDSTVKNGTRYYYALVSYDRGVVPSRLDPLNGAVGGLSASECTKIITEDFNGSLKFVDKNCAVVTPNAQAAGYVAAQLGGISTPLQHGGIGTGSMSTYIVNPTSVLEGYTYQIKFDSVGGFPDYKTKSFTVLRQAPASTAADTLIKKASVNSSSPPFDGLLISVQNDTVVVLNDTATGLLPGSQTNATLTARIDKSFPARNVAWPADYEIQFYSTNQDTGAFEDPSVPFIKAPVNFTITNITLGYRCKFLIQDMDGNGKFSAGDSIRILDGYKDDTNFKVCYTFSYMFTRTPIPPTDGDRFVIKTKKQFVGGDYFEFKSHASRLDNAIAKSQLDKISVVPNPYVVAAKWERRSLYQSGRGDRKIDFINLPAACTVRIFTENGALVKTIEKVPSATNGAVSWDLISDDGMEVAYGLYIYHVKAPAIGEHIGKFVVIK
ncbi:MAG: hypothetical protein PHP42_02455 [Bacteroidota bacterium]|nr:hypothetical protein [Bacteroidota bacterium]